MTARLIILPIFMRSLEVFGTVWHVLQGLGEDVVGAARGSLTGGAGSELQQLASTVTEPLMDLGARFLAMPSKITPISIQAVNSSCKQINVLMFHLRSGLSKASWPGTS